MKFCDDNLNVKIGEVVFIVLTIPQIVKMRVNVV